MRGGTTLLHTILASHAAIAVFARELRALIWCRQSGLGHILRVHHHLLLGNRWFRYPQFRRQVYRYLWCIIRENGLFQSQVGVESCHRAFAACLADSGSLYVGDKYPDYVFHCEEFIHRPDCRVILIVRDPRDVICSIFDRIHSGNWAGRSWVKKYSNIRGATNYWNMAARVMADLNTSKSGVLVIRYEDLVQQTRKTVSRISDHLEVDSGGFDISSTHAKSIGKHTRILEAAAIHQIEQNTLTLMNSFGYRSCS